MASMSETIDLIIGGCAILLCVILAIVSLARDEGELG